MNALAGTGQLIRLGLRRERTIAPWWLLTIAVMPLILVGYIIRSMGSDLNNYVTLINHNSFFRALGGAYVIPDLGYMAAWRSGGLLYTLSAVAAVLTIIRYTRADEDSGRFELLRAGAVSRFAALTAGSLTASGISLAGGVLVSGVLIAIGMDSFGSITYGAAVAAAGWFFGGVAAVAAQLARQARTARAICFAILGVAYILRYAGDASGWYWLKYVSPLGWIHIIEPYWHNRWWMLALLLALALGLTTLAYRLASRRDLGAGVIAERLGRANAPDLRGPISLSWRLHRSLLLKWVVGVGVFAVGAGGVTSMADQLLAAPTAFSLKMVDGFGGSPNATYFDNGLWAMTLIFGYVIALYPIMMVQRLSAEESSGRAEPVLATRLTRVRWAAGHLVVTAGGTLGLLILAGSIFGVVTAFILGDATHFPRLLAGAIGTTPAAWLVGAVGLLTYALIPRASVALCWLAWIATFALGRVAGPLYGLWGGTPVDPFHYIPNTVAGDAFNPIPAGILILLTAVLTSASLYALRHRDIQLQ